MAIHFRHLYIRSRTEIQNVKKGERFNGIHSPCWEKSTSTRLASASSSGHFSFLTVRVSILVELATTQAVLINFQHAPKRPSFPADRLCASNQRRSRGTKHVQLGGGPNSSPTHPGHELFRNGQCSPNSPLFCFGVFSLSVQPEQRHNSHSHIHKIANHNLRIDNR